MWVRIWSCNCTCLLLPGHEQAATSAETARQQQRWIFVGSSGESGDPSASSWRDFARECISGLPSLRYSVLRLYACWCNSYNEGGCGRLSQHLLSCGTVADIFDSDRVEFKKAVSEVGVYALVVVCVHVSNFEILICIVQRLWRDSTRSSRCRWWSWLKAWYTIATYVVSCALSVTQPGARRWSSLHSGKLMAIPGLHICKLSCHVSNVCRLYICLLCRPPRYKELLQASLFRMASTHNTLMSWYRIKAKYRTDGDVTFVCL